MCKAMEDMKSEAADMAAHRKAVDSAAAMVAADKYALEEISTLCGLSLEEVRLLQVDKML